jgi:hypothetical protein
VYNSPKDGLYLSQNIKWVIKIHELRNSGSSWLIIQGDYFCMLPKILATTD